MGLALLYSTIPCINLDTDFFSVQYCSETLRSCTLAEVVARLWTKPL